MPKFEMNTWKKNHQSGIKDEAQSPTVIAQRFVGPVPDPDTLAKYEQISPGFAERLICMAEKEQKFRHDTQQCIIQNQHLQHKREIDSFRIGQFLAILSVLLVVSLCFYGFYKGYSSASATIATSVIIGLASVFIWRSNKNPQPKQDIAD